MENVYLSCEILVTEEHTSRDIFKDIPDIQPVLLASPVEKEGQVFSVL